MIHTHKVVSMRELLRNPKESFPPIGSQTIVTNKGFPVYSIQNASVFMASANPDTMAQAQETPSVLNGGVNLVELKQDDKGEITAHEQEK
jgi:hypothetical protein